MGAWGSLDADLGFRTSVMAAAEMLRQGSARRPLQQVGDQVAKAPALNVRPLLQPLGEHPRQGGRDAGRLAPH